MTFIVLDETAQRPLKRDIKVVASELFTHVALDPTIAQEISGTICEHVAYRRIRAARDTTPRRLRARSSWPLPHRAHTGPDSVLNARKPPDLRMTTREYALSYL